MADKHHIRVIVRLVPLADRTTSSLIHRYLNRLLGDMRSERMVRALATDLLASPF